MEEAGRSMASYSHMASPYWLTESGLGSEATGGGGGDAGGGTGAAGGGGTGSEAEVYWFLHRVCRAFEGLPQAHRERLMSAGLENRQRAHDSGVNYSLAFKGNCVLI